MADPKTVLGLALLAGVAFAEEIPTVYSTSGKGDGYSETSFLNGDRWENGLPPGPGTNYVWKGTNLRTPDSSGSQYNGRSFVFAGGQLTMAAGAIAQKTRGANVTLTWPLLIWSVSGSYAQSCAPNTLARVCGTIQVDSDLTLASSPGSAPDLCHYDFSFENAFTHGEGKTITIKHYSQPSITFCTNIVRVSGDNSSYKGTWRVQNYSNTFTEEGMVLCLESGTALGETSETFDPAALTLDCNGALSVAPELEQPFAPRNKGVTLGPSGGRFTTVSNETWSLGMPVSGSGVLTKSGLGKVLLCGTYSATGAIAVEHGTLGLSSGFEAPNGLPPVDLASGASFTVEPSCGSVLDLRNAALPAGTTFVIAHDANEIGRVSLAESCSLPQGPISVRFVRSGEPPTETVRREFLTVPVSVRELTAMDFVEDLSMKALTDPPRQFEVTVENGLQHVRVVLNPVVYKNAEAQNDNSRWWFTTVSATVNDEDVYLWDDQKACHGGADYVITNQVSFRTGASQSNSSVIFPGASLTMTEGALALKQTNICFTNLVLRKNASVAASGSGAVDRKQWLAGRIEVGGTRSAPILFSGQKPQNCCVSADLVGDGFALFAIYSSANAQNAMEVFSELTGDNSRFTGAIFVDRKVPTGMLRNEQTNFVLRATSAASLGGARPTFLPDALCLRPYAAFQPINSMTLDEPNRGIYLDGSPCRFLVTNGIELVVKETITFAGRLRKEGTGTLALGGATVFAEGATETGILVQEGWLKPLSAATCRDLEVQFSAAGGLCVDAVSTNDDVRAYGLLNVVEHSFDVESLNVRLENPPEESKFETVLCTVHPNAARRLREKIKVARPSPDLKVQGIREEEVEVDGVALKRFTVQVATSGLTVIFR